MADNTRNELLEQILSASGSFDPSTDLGVERLISSSSIVDIQEPAGLGAANAMPIRFGAAVSTPQLSLSDDGALTVIQAGTYRIQLDLQFARTGSGGTSELLFRLLVNGNQVGESVHASVQDSNATRFIERSRTTFFPAGSVVTFEVMRDSNGSNSGGLFAYIPTAEAGSWNKSPSASLSVERFV